jgi:predicted TIM-barrel fold metal-dependent hydrolase
MAAAAVAHDKLFSADSHVSEPLDLWTARLDRKFRDRAPHAEVREQDGQPQELWVFEGFEPHRLSVGIAAAAAPGDRQTFRTRGSYADARPGGWDPVERLKDQDVDGVSGEVLHTTLGFRLFWLEDPELQRACFRVYNDWLAEYCRHSPRRLVGLGLISLVDVGLGVAELERCARIGLKGAMIWNSPPDDRPYSSPEYDPFWAAAQELEMPVSFHALTGHHESRIPLNSVFFIMSTYHEVERTLATIILSGVLERFPRLRLVSVESQAGWIPYFLQRLDHAGKTRKDFYPTRLSLTPRDYFHRQVCATYIDDPLAIRGLALIGEDNLLWSSDYPHNASTWPRSREIVDRDFGHLGPEVRRKVVRGNVMKLYRLNGGKE